MTEHEHPGRRLEPFDVAGLSPDQRSLYDTILRERSTREPQAFSLVDRSGRLGGPFNAMLLCPPLGHVLQALGAAIRFGGDLTDRAREIAILVVAQVWGSDFERFAHEAIGRAVGLSEAELVAIRSGKLDIFTDEYERLVATVTEALARRGDLDDTEFAATLETLDPALVFELTTLVGYYATLALQLRVFRVSPSELSDPAEMRGVALDTGTHTEDDVLTNRTPLS